jgi:hypothetical protein
MCDFAHLITQKGNDIIQDVIKMSHKPQNNKKCAISLTRHSFSGIFSG